MAHFLCGNEVGFAATLVAPEPGQALTADNEDLVGLNRDFGRSSLCFHSASLIAPRENRW